MSQSSSATVLFDIDGTLVDSNYLHVEAWARTFDDLGAPVDSWRIHRSIGMDSGKLLQSLLGTDTGPQADRAREIHTTHYDEIAPRLRPFEGARELIAELSRRDVHVVLATSAPGNELDNLLKTLRVDEWVTAVTSAEDVEVAKPDPDVLLAAIEKSDADPRRSILVGDTVWDVAAASRAGLSCIAVETGGISRAELESAGAVAVYTNVSELLAALDNSRIMEL